MKIKANAKINLGLDIISKRSDGYHDLKTLFFEIPLFDELEFSPRTEPGVELTCSDGSLCSASDNTVYRAAELMFERYALSGGIRIHIEKNIPSGAGLGGGSSDAAAALKAMNEMYALSVSTEELEEIGALIGADVPFFIRGGAALGLGKGERLAPIDGVKLPPLLLAVLPIHVSTKAAYAEADRERELFHPDVDALLEALRDGNFHAICEKAGNSFERPIFRLFPKIKRLRDAMIEAKAGGCVMSGSGSSMLALYENNEEAQAAADDLKARFSGLETFVLPARRYG